MGQIKALSVVQRRWRLSWLTTALLVHLLLTSYQLGLPGLHYDEAKEAGINAMEIVTGAEVTAFRGVAVSMFGTRLPLMVQDYIGAMNVYLALPFLQLTGIGVPNLRAVSVLTSMFALLLVERAVSSWWLLVHQKHGADENPGHQLQTPITLAGLVTVTLLAGAPSYVFWARQGIFVTNLTQPLYLLMIWQGVLWLRNGAGWSLLATTLAAGLALYAKLIAVWVVGPFMCLLLAGWVQYRRAPNAMPRLVSGWGLGAMAAFVLAIAPLLYFNWQTGGTLTAVLTNARSSYYGVDNLALGANLVTRATQFWQVLRGEPFWYLGAVHVNPLVPWFVIAFVLVALYGQPMIVAPGLILMAGVFILSLFTITDLFVTHYALLPPLIAGTVGISVAVISNNLTTSPQPESWQRVVMAAILGVWVILDLATSVRYHAALRTSGGLSDHSDASYQLAYHLRYNGFGAPIVLDWGIEASVRYLSQGTVRPVELFGYDSPAKPAPEFALQLGQYLQQAGTVYVLHAAEQTVFHGRREVFFDEAVKLGKQPVLERTFTQRDGAPIFELWRLDSS